MFLAFCFSVILASAITVTTTSEHIALLRRNRREITSQVGEPCPPLKTTHVNVKCMYKDVEVSCNYQMQSGTTATTSCEPGYIVAYDPGYSHLECLNSGYWDNTMIYCTRAEPCPPLKALHVNVKCMFQNKNVSCNQQMQPGTIAISRCEPGYSPIYKPTYSHVECLKNGYWDNPLIYCTQVVCPPLKSQNTNTNVKCTFRGKEVPCDSPMRPGTIATAECKPNYKPTDDPVNPQRTCQNNGSWEHSLFSCTAVCGLPNEDSAVITRILEGVASNIGDFPWHAGLFYRKAEGGNVTWEHRCAGSLITDLFVLTAAHCVVDVEEPNIRIGLGKFYRSWDRHEPTEQKRNVSTILYPSAFNKKTYLQDIALLVMDKKVEFGKFIMPVCNGILDGASYITNKTLYVVGWGQTTDERGGSLSETLLYNDVMMVPENLCRKTVPSDYPLFDKFCTVKNNLSEASIVQPGDSGGGLTALYEGLHYIFGVVSLKFRSYSIFTNITWTDNLIWCESEIRKYNSTFKWTKV